MTHFYRLVIKVSAYTGLCCKDLKSNLVWRAEALGTALVLETDRAGWPWPDGGGGLTPPAELVLSTSPVLPGSLGLSSISPMRRLRLRPPEGHSCPRSRLRNDWQRFEPRSIWFLSFCLLTEHQLFPDSPLTPPSLIPSQPAGGKEGVKLIRCLPSQEFPRQDSVHCTIQDGTLYGEKTWL